MQGWNAGWIGALWMLVMWGAILAAIYAVARSIAGPRAPREPDPVEILDERFARGEISAEERAERRRVLQQGRM